MQRRWFIAVLACCLVVAGGTASAQQQTTSSEVRTFEILAVDGNKVVVRGEKGTQEITVPPEFQLTVDGKPVTVQQLKPGMKGTARITTTTTVTPVYVTEVRNGTVTQKSGGSIIVRTDKGFQMFTEGEVAKRGVRLMRDGQPMEFASISTGDRLTATIITEQPPRVMTETQVQAAMKSAPAPGGAAAAPAASASASAGTAAAAPGGSPGTAARRLPKTAGPLPLLAVFSAAALGVGGLMTALRRRRQR